MFNYFLAGLSSSLISLQWQPSLLATSAAISMLITAILLLYFAVKHPNYRLLLYLCSGLIFGVGYGNLYAKYALGKVLPDNLQRQDIEMLVEIESVAPKRSFYQRSQVKVLDFEAAAIKRLQLDWYKQESIQACDIWRVVVRLKQPHGLRNPGAWSSRRHALEKHIHGKGYVRQAEKIAEKPFCLQRHRMAWQHYVLNALPVEQAAWVLALSTGEKSYLSAEQYQLLQTFGINHLFVISGLHIGLCATAVYGLLMLLRRLGLGLVFKGSWQLAAGLLAMLAAVAYSAIAGFGIPAQRALIMLLVFFAASMVGIRMSLWFRFYLAMALVLLINPFSAMNLGFALSFGAVAVLIALSSQLRKQGRVAKLRLVIESQFAIALGLSPLLILYFAQISLLSPLINLVAIPYVSFLIVPLVLLAMLLWALLAVDYGLLSLTSKVLELLMNSLQQLQLLLTSYIDISVNADLTQAAIILWAWVCVVILLWRRFVWRYLAIAITLLATVLLPSQHVLKEGELHIAFIDVGQGLSVLVRTQNHAMLYDTGAAWPGGSMADRVVLPVLRYFNVKRLNKVVISHFDNDHAGGWRVIDKSITVEQWLAPSNKAPFDFCQKDLSWTWDGMRFQMLSPSHDFVGSDNDSSCVLLITTLSGRHILFTGDIGKKVEVTLLQDDKLKHVDVLQVGHHGSKTSSSYALLQRMQKGDAVAVYSTAYLNRYGHPHQEVVKRFQDYGIKTYNTAYEGMIEVLIDQQGNVKANTFRQQHKRYWDDVTVNHLEY